MSTLTLEGVGANRREFRSLAVVSTVHLVSHFYWLLFVPLLPSLRDLLQVSYVELGFAMFVMNIVSAIFQAPTGFLVDRFGPRLFLVVGVALGAAGFILLGAAPGYPMLLVSAVLIGVGNAVYHPADYSILSAEISPQRIGRAYSIHTFSGYLGFALTPPVILALVYAGGPRTALISGGLIGIFLSLPLLFDLRAERRTILHRATSTRVAKTPSLSLFTPAVMALTAMFTVLNLSTNMMQTYMVVSLRDLDGLSQTIGEASLTVFMFTLVAGVLAGGFLADRVRSKGLVTLGGFGCAGAITLMLGVAHFGPVATVGLIGLAGFLAGLIMPSRDMLVSQASPPDAVGRVFGIVTTGFNLGGMVGPLLGGMLIDRGMPAWIFYSSALFMAITIAIAMIVEKTSTAAK